MILSDILIISSIIVGLVSIPFLVTGPLSDSIPTGKLVLNMNQSQVEGIPSKMSKVFSSEKFEKTYETAFGRFTMRISAGEIFQQLSKPGKVTIVTEDTEKTIWKITTQQYQLEITRTPNSVTQICTTPDGELKKVKETGEITESFQGMNQDYVLEVCAQAEQDLQEEVQKMEQIKSESEIPSTETKINTTTTIPSGQNSVVINEFLPDPVGSDSDPKPDGEWVELYNMKDSSVDVGNWVLYDSTDTNELYITSSNTNTGNTTIPSHGFLVVYRNSDGDFSLGNTGDEVRLYDGYPVSNSTLIDKVTYTSSEEGVSLARVPDGSGSLQEDTTPTPGVSNG